LQYIEVQLRSCQAIPGKKAFEKEEDLKANACFSLVLFVLAVAAILLAAEPQ
jgi:hypothetical protein